MTANDCRETELSYIPADWGVVRLGELATVKYGRATPQSYGSVPVVGSGGVFAWTNQVLIDHPTLVIGRKGTAGKVWYMERSSWPSDTTFYLEWKREVDVRFVFGHLTLRPLSGQHAKTTLPSLQRPDLENYLISLPPLPEQRRIARVLSTIQRAIQAQDAVIAAARELKRSLMHRLFTYGPYAEPLPTRETEIGEVPEGWEVGSIGSLVTTTQYGLNELAGAKGAYPMLRMNNVVDGKIEVSDIKYVDLDESTFERFRLSSDDLVFNRTNSYELVGKTGLVGVSAGYVFASYLIRVVPDQSRVVPRFLNYYLNWEPSKGRMQKLATRGVSQSNISATKLRSFEIVVPPLAHQRSVATALDAVESKMQHEVSRRKALEALFKSMLHQLMTGQVRVPVLDR